MNNDIKTSIIINMLFRTLTSIFPAFKQAWPSEPDFEDAKKEWLKAFIQAGITDINQIKNGVNAFRLMANPFVPSPGQFIALCKPSRESLGIPSNDQAYRIACIASGKFSDKNWVHVTIEHAATKIGKLDLNSKPEAYTYKIFERHFENSIQDFINGKLQDTSTAIIDDSKETVELSKQHEIANRFKHINNHSKWRDDMIKVGFLKP